MPTYRKPNEDEVALLVAHGQKPDRFVIDEDTEEAVDINKADTTMGAVGETLKGAGRGLRDTAAGAVKYVGEFTDALREGPKPGSIRHRAGDELADALPGFLKDKLGLEPEPDQRMLWDKLQVPANPNWHELGPDERSSASTLGERIGKFGEDTLKADPLNEFSGPMRRGGAKVGEVVGQLLPLVLTRGLAQKLALAEQMGAGAQDVVERDVRRQEAEGGDVSRAEAVGKGGEYIPLSLIEQSALAKLGKFAPFNIKDIAARIAAGEKGLVPALKALGWEAAQGASGTAIDTATRQALGDEKLDVGEIAAAAATGAAAQAGIGAAHEVTGRFTSPKEVAEAKKAEMANEKSETPATEAAETRPDYELPTQEAPLDDKGEIRIKAMMDAQGRGYKHDPLNPSPVDEIFKDLQKKGIQVDENVLRRLERIYNNDVGNTPRLQEAARLITDQLAVARPDKAVPETALVKRQNQEVERIDTQLEAVKSKAQAIKEQMDAEMQEAAKQPPTGNAGDVWLDIQKRHTELRVQELGRLEQQARALLEARRIAVGANDVVPAGGAQPIGAGQEQSSVLTAAQREMQAKSRIMTAEEANAQKPEIPLGELPNVAPANFEGSPVEPREIIPSRDPAIAAQVAEAIARSEQRLQQIEDRIAEINQSVKQPSATGNKALVDERQALRQEMQAELDRVKLQRKTAPATAQAANRPSEIERFMAGEDLPGMTLEGEQSSPFSGESRTESETYGTLIPPDIFDGAKKYLEEKIKPYFKDKGVLAADPLTILKQVTQAEHERLASKSWAGAWVSRNMDALFLEQRKIANRKLGELAEIQKKHPDLLKDERFVKWYNERHTTRKTDLEKLPPEIRAGAQELVNWTKSFHNEQRARGIYVEAFENGKRIYRPAVDIEGYGIFDINPDVYRAMEEGGEKWAAFQKDWMDNWVKHKGNNLGAAEALENWRAPVARTHSTGGEPLFPAVRNETGVPLPESWRSTDLTKGFEDYTHKWAADVGWAEVIQKNPLMRRAFGVTNDPMGRRTVEQDMLYKPTKAEWDAIIDYGARIGAPWLKSLTPKTEFGSPISGNDPFAVSLLASYKRQGMGRSTTMSRAAEAANQIAGSVMMMHKSKVRNILQAGSTIFEHVTGPEFEPALRGLVDSIASPAEAVRKATTAGVLEPDIMRQEVTESVAGGLYKTARAWREFFGLNAMDKYAKALAYNVAESAVRAQVKRLGKESPLVKEFGPADTTKIKTVDQLIKDTAATISNHIDPAFDARSLPEFMIPQNRAFVGNLFRLMTWSVGRYNHWYNDVYRPAVKHGEWGKLGRSVLVAAVGAAGTQELLSFLTNKMPRDLSLAEWSKLEEGKAEEFAPMLFSYLQAQGAMGILGDIAYAGSRLATGKSVTQDYSRPMVPLLLVGRDVFGTLLDFDSYARKEKGGYRNLDLTDLMNLGVELGKTAQTARDIVDRGDSWLPERTAKEVDAAKLRREQRVYEDTTGKSSVTGQIKDPLGINQQGAAAFSPNPFSLNKEFQYRTGDSFDSLIPALEAAAERGWSPKTQKGILDRGFYENIEMRRGGTVAERLMEQGQDTERERLQKKALSTRLGRTAARVRARGVTQTDDQ